MLRRAWLVAGLLALFRPAAAQNRAVVGEVRLALPTGIAAPSLGTPPFAPSFSPAASLTAPSLSAPALAAPAALAAPVAAPAPTAVPAASIPTTPALLPSAAPSAAPAAAPATALSAASAMVETRDDGKTPSSERAAAAFDGAKPLSVLIAGAEAVPFIKTGGLADVVDAVARGLAERGHAVMMVLPKYRVLKTDRVDFRPAGTVSVPIGDRVETAKLETATVNGVKVVLLDHPFYDREGGPYASKSSVYGEDDNDERFAFFSRAALEAARALDFRPDVAHAHDWHAALIPAFLKLQYSADPFFAATKSVLTIHNIAFQGNYDAEVARKLGFAERDAVRGGPLDAGGYFSYLKSGITLADAVTTVSPTYAKEIETPKFGMGMEDALNARGDGAHGILNGIDPEIWNPATDPIAARHYDASTVAEGKAENKAWLQKNLHLDEDPDAPLFSVASRLAHQKGIDLAIDAIDEMVARGAQVLISGSGDKPLEAAVAEAVARHPGKVAWHPFDDALVRAVFAASDFLLMPSRFEPCGLSQLIAQRYGTLPIATRTGGLADTVADLRVDAERGDGILVRDFTVLALVEAVEAAIAGYRNPAALATARATAMAKDSSWGPALDAYEALFRSLIAADDRAASAAPASGDKASSTSSASDERRDGSSVE